MKGQIAHVGVVPCWDHVMDINELIATANFAVLDRKGVVLVHNIYDDMAVHQLNGTVLEPCDEDTLCYAGDMHVGPSFIEDYDITADWARCEEHFEKIMAPRQ